MGKSVKTLSSRNMNRLLRGRWRRTALTLLMLAAQGAVAMETARGIDPDAQLPFWSLRDEGMSLRLVQRLPDQTRGFFLARGFSAAQVERVALSCVFQTDFRNLSADGVPLSYDLRDWVVHYQGQARRMKLREDWAREWQRESVGLAARTAFEWALYPTAQVYQPGDYNWGMSIFDLPPGARFDLEVVWTQGGGQRRFVIKDMQCAPDIHPEPGETAN